MAKKDLSAREIFSDKSLVIDFISLYSPELSKYDIREENLEMIETSLIEPDLSEIVSDIFYKVTFKEESFYLYFHLEHQSSVDHSMPIRIMLYQAGLWKKEYKESKEKAKNKKYKLPPIYSYILYDGAGKWNVTENFADKINKAGEYEPFRAKVIDLNKIDSQTLINSKKALNLLLLMRKENKKEMLYDIVMTAKEVLKDPELKELNSYFRHLTVFLKGVLEPAELEDLRLSGNIEDMEVKLVSILEKERLIYKKQGRAEGKAEGLLQGIYESIHDILEIRFQEDGLRLMKKIRKINDLVKLRDLKDVIKKAKSIEEIEEKL